MNNKYKFLFSLFLSIILTVSVAAAVIAQEKVDMQKIYKEIAGDYEMEDPGSGEVQIITFFIEDGELYGGPEGETPEVIEPVEGETLKFTASTPDGQEFELTFNRDEDTKKIISCTLSVPAMGMELEMKKIKDGGK